MLHTCLQALVLAATLAPSSPARQDDPCRRPHCTLAEGDLAAWLSLIAWTPSFDGDRFELGRGEGRNAWSAGSRLWELHRFGHGGWPGVESPALLVETGSVACDASSLLALYTAISSRIVSSRQEDRHVGWLVDDIASLLERNGRLELAERVLRLAIPHDCTPETSSSARGHMEWFELGRFLFRRGRYDEALWIFGRLPELGGCSLGGNPNLDWMERCCAALADEAGLFGVWTRRIKTDKAVDAGWAAAEHFAARGFTVPETEASSWFDGLRDDVFARVPRESARSSFVEGVERWRRWIAGERPANFVDISAPGGMELAILRAKETASTDPWNARWLLSQAAASGSPTVGIAILEMAADRGIQWNESDRSRLLECWSDGIMTRTFGCADPEDPSTW
jgi:hypothetical protein